MPEVPSRGIFATWKEVTLRPRRFFADPPSRWSGWSPLAFVAVTTAASIGASECLRALQSGLLDDESQQLLVGQIAMGVASVTVANAATAHAALWILGGRKATLRMTTAAICYGATPQLLGAGLVAMSPLWSILCWAWSVGLGVLGLVCVHKAPVWKAAVAILSFYAILVVIYLLIYRVVAI